MPTPLDADGLLDRAACKAIVEHVREGGVDGLWVMGTGAGFASLSPTLRREAIAAYFDAADSLPVMVGVSDNSLATVRENLRELDQYAPVAVFSSAPHFYIYDEHDLETFFRSAADAAEVPFVIYNNDTNTKTPISLDLVEALSDHPNIAGIKDSTCNLAYHLQLLDRFHDHDDFRIISGDDWGLALGPAVGTAAFVAASPLIGPKLVGELKDAVDSGAIERARELQHLHTTLMNIYGLRNGTDSGFLAAQAAALHLLGLATAMTPEPCRPPDAREIALVRDVLAATGLLV